MGRALLLTTSFRVDKAKLAISRISVFFRFASMIMSFLKYLKNGINDKYMYKNSMIDSKSNLFSISSGGGFVFSLDFAGPVSKQKNKLYKLKSHHFSHY